MLRSDWALTNLSFRDTFTDAELLKVQGFDPIRKIEIVSIGRFVEANADYLRGRVLDFGAGKPGTCREPEPYREFITGEYVPFDVGDPEPTGKFDAILCTGVMQYLGPVWAVRKFYGWLKAGGWLVISYTTNWDVVETCDLWRYTPHGMNKLLTEAGFHGPVYHERRAEVGLGVFTFPLGYGVVCQKPKLGGAVKLNLGCGKKPLEGYVNIDWDMAPGVDLACNILDGLPYDDDSVEEIYSENFLEHLPADRRVWIMNEMWRVLKPRGFARHLVPKAGTRPMYQDPTHLSNWHPEMFTYFDVAHARHVYYDKTRSVTRPWIIRSVRLTYPNGLIDVEMHKPGEDML